MFRDIRHAGRSLARSPIFTVTATLALGLAIGANAAIFGLVDGLWFRPAGVRETGTIVRVFSTTPTGTRTGWSWPEYERLRDGVRGFDGVIARGRRGAVMHAADGSRTLLLVNVVSTDFFSTLGVQPAFGRLLTPGDQQPVAVLGHAFWRRQFGSDPSIVGKTITLDRGSPVPVTVVGILPSTFRDLEAAADRDLWLPPSTWIQLANRREFERRDERWFDVIARRRPGVSVHAASAEVQAVAAAMATDFPPSNAGRAAQVVSDFDYRMENAGTSAVALLGLVLLVVLITCVNLANLLLARAAARSRELAVRVALGVGRGRLLGQLMIESALIGGVGAIVGITLAMWMIRLLPALLVPPPGLRSMLLFETDARVLLFTAVITVLTTVLFGTVPSVIAARADVAPLLKGEARIAGAARPNNLAQRALVILQIATSFVLLCAAAVLVRSFIETKRADIGISRKPLLTAWISASDTPPDVTRSAIDRIRALPGVTRVAAAIRAPLSLSGGGMAQPIYIPGRTLNPDNGLPEIKFTAVSGDYFDVLGTRLFGGRLLTEDDQRPGNGVIVINEKFAREFFPGGDPLGATVRLGSTTGPEHRIVGIVQNAVISAIGEEAEPYFYLPYWRGRYGEVTLIIEGRQDAALLAQPVRIALQHIDPRLEPRRLVTMPEYIRYSASTYHAIAALGTALGLTGLVLTALGVYGVIAYQTAGRRREIGIRVALGAARGQVLRLVLNDGLRFAVIGLAIGIPAALLVTKAIASMLFGTSPWDVPAFAGACAVLLAAVAAATFVPARRAMRVSPSTALRDS